MVDTVILVAVGIAVIVVSMIIVGSTKPEGPSPIPSDVEVSELFVYPVKSAAGVPVTSAVLDSQCGFAYDRLWTVVDTRGVFMSQRRTPKLALLQPSLPKSDSEALEISGPGMPTINVPQLEKTSKKVVRIWEDRVQAVDQGDEIAAWLSKFLDMPGLRLVRMPKSTNRWCDKKYATFGSRAAFSDGFPVLITSNSSLDDLNTKLKAPVGMDRFRANVVVKGPSLAPWAEDAWYNYSIAVGNEKFFVAKPCARCKMPTIDQKTGKVGGEGEDDPEDDLGGGPKPGAEPTKTLSTFRTGKHIGYADKSWNDEVFFGQNICHVPGLLTRLGLLKHAATISVGDKVALA